MATSHINGMIAKKWIEKAVKQTQKLLEKDMPKEKTKKTQLISELSPKVIYMHMRWFCRVKVFFNIKALLLSIRKYRQN